MYAAFMAVQMGGIGGEFSRFSQWTQGDLLPARVVNAQEPGFLPHPDLPSGVFGWCAVMVVLEPDIAIAMHRTERFFNSGTKPPAVVAMRGTPSFSKRLPIGWHAVPWMRVLATLFSQLERKRFCPARLSKLWP
jgi:hypothetical protein